MKKRYYRKIQIILSVTLAVLVFLFAVASFFFVACLVVDNDARVLPSYERVDIGSILEKRKNGVALLEEEKETLCYQTGVFDLDWLLEQSDSKILKFQDALYFKGTVRHDNVAWTTPHDILYDPETNKPYKAPIVDLQPGDILLTSTCHTYGWRNGHAAIILSGDRILQSFSLGWDSDVDDLSRNNGAPWFQQASNFMVLRLKGASAEERKLIADNAEKALVGVPYDLTVGIFMKKDQGMNPKGTHCSHLVWQAYKNAGYDIDFDGGPVATCRDIANSPYLEVVQIYGFDPVKGW